MSGFQVSAPLGHVETALAVLGKIILKRFSSLLTIPRRGACTLNLWTKPR